MHHYPTCFLHVFKPFHQSVFKIISFVRILLQPMNTIYLIQLPELRSVVEACNTLPRACSNFEIIFPRIRSSLFSGATLSLSRSIGEYGSIVILSSNLPFDDLVTPVLIFQKLEQYDYTSASIIGVTILLLSLSILFIIGSVQSKYLTR